MTPRSPKIEYDTSGARIQSGRSVANHRATASWKPECRAEISRSRSPPRHRVVNPTWTSSTRAMLSSVPIATCSRWPRSMFEMTDRSTRARIATSICRQPRLIRTARKVAPHRWRASMPPSLSPATHLMLIRTPALRDDHAGCASGHPCATTNTHRVRPRRSARTTRCAGTLDQGRITSRAAARLRSRTYFMVGPRAGLAADAARLGAGPPGPPRS